MSISWQTWKAAEDDLQLEIVAPFEVSLAPTKKLAAELLVKNFGDRNGMLVFTNYDVVKPHREQLQNLGYGYSVLEKPKENEDYVREDFIDLLSDWGWTGDRSMRPKWIIPM